MALAVELTTPHVVLIAVILAIVRSAVPIVLSPFVWAVVVRAFVAARASDSFQWLR